MPDFLIWGLIAGWTLAILGGIFMAGFKREAAWIVAAFFWPAVLLMLPVVALYFLGESIGDRKRARDA